MAEYVLGEVVFGFRLMGETMMVRSKFLETQIEEDWKYGKARLCNPPFDSLALFVRKIEVDGSSLGAAMDCATMVRVFARYQLKSHKAGEGVVVLQEERGVNEGSELAVAQIGCGKNGRWG